MRKKYITPQTEAKDNRWGWLWDDEYRFKSLFDEVEESENGWKP